MTVQEEKCTALHGVPTMFITELDHPNFTQYDLSSFEDSIGWASGFGMVFNYTNQDFSGGSEEDCTSGRGEQVLGPDICIPRGLLDFSEDAYNFTLYYENFSEFFRCPDFCTRIFGNIPEARFLYANIIPLFCPKSKPWTLAHWYYIN